MKVSGSAPRAVVRHQESSGSEWFWEVFGTPKLIYFTRNYGFTIQGMQDSNPNSSVLIRHSCSFPRFVER